jgi:pyruvate formate lyase activating enzyme
VTTKSAALAYGVSWLCLKIGRLPSLYENLVDIERTICGRKVKQSPRQFTIVWYESPAVRRGLVVTEDFYLIPIRSLEVIGYDGDVFNIEVEEEHNYLANFVLVANCQNWLTSQALRDPAAGIMPEDVAPDRLVEVGLRHGAELVSSSYNEPLITAEWAVDVFKKAREAGLRTCFVSNGNATREVLTFLRPWCDCYKIDLKTMSPRGYRRLGGVLDRVLDAVRMVHEMGFWMEIVTLVIPGWNDSEQELRAAAQFIASVSQDIPWHVTAFHPDYRMTDADYTQVPTLLRAARIGQEAGLRFVYAGNLPGRVGEYEHTYCPGCRAVLVERWGFHIRRNRLAATGGHCPDCGQQIPGVWA